MLKSNGTYQIGRRFEQWQAVITERAQIKERTMEENEAAVST